ncbi:stage III sporulation protein AG [Anaerostipes sp. MSJ-23]|uniref:stage III sporulation protein AG n=1 Tax=Anaerostipes sp. MSJ-23 TaxID=2841520 RepID=UPI001C116572|nr:stage III sporulation protein AG [Anaerostipes sp. MSJ-23]MBU5460958.1 stage III sporulation protein AG [Anaerostipes sp. MSJ-23]
MIERDKLKNIIETIGIKKIILMLALGIFLILFSFPSASKTQKKQKETTISQEDSTDVYVKKQEQRLVRALKQVEGVGKVKVMITVKSSTESVINKDSPYEESTNEKEKTVKEGEETILVEEDGKKVPYVIKKIEPEVEGVVVVAQGGGNDVVSRNIVEAVSVLFHISSYKVKVLKMEDLK